MSNYYEYRDVKVKIAHRLFNMDGWKVYGYYAGESDPYTDYYSPASWDGIAEKNGYRLVIDKSRATEDRTETRTRYGSKGITAETAAKIAKLEKMTQERGASAQEEQTAKSAIEKLRAKDAGSDETYTVFYPGHLANPPRCNWHIEKDGIIISKGTGLLKYASVPDTTDERELKDWQDYNNMTPEEWKKETAAQYMRRWNDSKERAQECAERDYKYAAEKYALLEKFNELIAKWNNTAGSMVSNGGEAGVYVYEEQTITEYREELKPVKDESGSIKDGQCFRTVSNFNYGHAAGQVFRIHAITYERNGESYTSWGAVRLGKGYKKECNGTANSANHWHIWDIEKFLKWFDKNSLEWVKLEEVKTPYQVKKVVKKYITPEATETATEAPEEAQKDNSTTDTENSAQSATQSATQSAQEAETMTDTYTKDSEITTGMQFTDRAGDVHTITAIDSMKVDFNNGQHSLFDFGTSRTIGAILNSLGSGSRFTSGTLADDPAAEVETDKEEPATEEATQEEPATEAAPDMFATLAAAYATGKQAKITRATETKPEPPQEEEPAEFTTPGDNVGKLHTEKEINGKIYVIDAADLRKDCGFYEVVIMRKNGDTIKEHRTKSAADARRVFWEYCELWTPKTAPGYTGKASVIFTPEDITAMTSGGQAKREVDKLQAVSFSTRYNDSIDFIYTLSSYFNDPLKPNNKPDFTGIIYGGKAYTDKTPILDELTTDIENAIRRQIPTEEKARSLFEATQPEKWMRENVQHYENSDWTQAARKEFYNGKPLSLRLYKDHPSSWDDVLRYIENPAEIVTEYSTAYINGHIRDILTEYIEYNRTAAALDQIESDPADVAHTIKRITDCISEEKTVKIELNNGETVTAEARAVKMMIHNSRIDDWYIRNSDRDKLPKDDNGRTKDIYPADIVAIKHGTRTLYRAA